jgi:hypothetical protein
VYESRQKAKLQSILDFKQSVPEEAYPELEAVLRDAGLPADIDLARQIYQARQSRRAQPDIEGIGGGAPSEEEVRKIEEALARNGVPVTPENVIRLYRVMQYTRR